MPAFFKAVVIDMKWPLSFSRAVLAAVLWVGWVSVAYAASLTSIEINRRSYGLTILSHDEHAEAIKLFNQLETQYKKETHIKECSFVIDLPVGTAHGNHSYGGYCTSWVNKEYEYLTVCADVMLGRLKIQSHDKKPPRNNIQDLAKYVADNCYGG